MSSVLFAVALFLSAALLFIVQPMAGKVLLPLAGGTPAVWTTCLVFFQTVLLLGYLYAHRLTVLPPRRQVMLHLTVIVLGLVLFLVLRPDAEWVPADQDYPVLGLILFLAVLVGAPFFVLSATAPILQRWFAATGHPAGRDPYFLYAASNAGSLIGLIGYPFLVEPILPLAEQVQSWVIGYAAFFLLAFGCGLLVWSTASATPVTAPESPTRTPGPDRLRILKWVAVAAVPSSLLMGVTTHLTTDVAPVPLLWVGPLALYLISFVVVFARWPEAARLVTGRVVPVALLALVVTLLTAATEPITLVMAVHLVAFLGVALLCHGELAHDRPSREHLTTFYLALSAGGVLGGLFNALLAPVLFAKLGLVEYPLVIALAALVRPRRGGSLEPLQLRPRDGLLLAGFALIAGLMAWIIPRVIAMPANLDDPDALPLRLLRGGLAFGVTAVIAFALVRNPARFAICLGILFLAGQLNTGPYGTILLVERNFFGTLRVTRSTDGNFIQLVHGTTQHGAQRADETGPPRPLMYYHQNGPVGRMFAKLPPERRRRVAVVGLGCGAMAAYARPGQEWTFYEIDPAVVRIASDTRYFTFLKECQVRPEIVLGDARRQLAHAPDGSFDLIVLDAFSSDAVPVHLMTREAFALYARKLTPEGVLAFHLSNRYLDLVPLVARLGDDHGPPFLMWMDHDYPTDRDRADGKFQSIWSILARDPTDVGEVPTARPAWSRVDPEPGPLWRDDFSNLLGVWKSAE